MPGEVFSEIFQRSAVPTGLRLDNTLDNRTPLQKLRRPWLRLILKSNGHDVADDMPADNMRKLVEAHGIDIRTVNFQKLWDDYRAGVKAAEAKDSQEAKEAYGELAEVPMPKLRQLAKSKGIRCQNTDTKSDILRKLSENPS